MVDDDNGELGRIPAEYISRAVSAMPDPATAVQATGEAVVDVPLLGSFRIRCELKRNPRWHGHRFWVATRADRT